MKIKVGVMFGGESVEHEVSIISAVQAMKFLDNEKYEVVPIYISKEKEFYTGKMLMDLEIFKDLKLLKKYAKNVTFYNKNNLYVLQNKKGLKNIINEVDIVLPVVHGTNVEDGTLQGFLETIGVPYVGCNVYSSVVNQDKVFAKQIFESCNIPITDYVWCFDSEFYDDFKIIKDKVKKLGYPVIIKPATLGSSVGINVVKKESDLEEALKDSFKYDFKVVIEKLVSNLKEVNCSAMGNYENVETSVIEEVIKSEDILSYKDKYISKNKSKGMLSTSRIIPAKLDKKLESEIKNLTEKVFKTNNCSGVVRIDFLLDSKTNKLYVNEINSIPGSLSFYLWEKTDKAYSKLLDELISIGIKNYKKKKSKIYSFDSNILSSFNGSKGKLKV